MSDHRCSRCAGLSASIRDTNSEIVNLLRVAQKRPGTPQAAGSLTRVAELKERVTKTRGYIKEHLNEQAS